MLPRPSGSKFRDLDGNEYIDHNLCFGTLMAGHSHPAVIKAVEGRLHKGTVYGMPHNMEWELAEEICTRFPVEMCRFGNSGTEATMHSDSSGPRRYGDATRSSNSKAATTACMMRRW